MLQIKQKLIILIYYGKTNTHKHVFSLLKICPIIVLFKKKKRHPPAKIFGVHGTHHVSASDSHTLLIPTLLDNN